MSELGDIFGALKEHGKCNRDSSYRASLNQTDEARKEAKSFGVDLLTGNGGHHWRFVYKGKTILSFWPASAKAQRPKGDVYRCRGYKHALNSVRAIVAKL